MMDYGPPLHQNAGLACRQCTCKGHLPPCEQGDAILNVAPKKANWDLRRDVAKKLEKLERRTQRALVQLMQEQQREQLAQNGGEAG